MVNGDWLDSHWDPRRAKSAVADADVEWWQHNAVELARANGLLGEPFLEQSFWTQASEAARLLGDDDARFALLRELAEAKLREARARTQGPGASFLAGASLMEAAVDYLERLRSAVSAEADRTAIAEEVRRLKLEIRTFYREGEAEMGFFEIPVDISREMLEGTITSLLASDNLAECLQRVGASLLPDLDQAEQWANSRANDDSIMSVAGVSLMGNGMEIRAYTSDQEKRQYEINRSLDWQIKVYSGIVLPLVFERLQQEKGLTAQTLMEYLDNWGFVEESNRPLVQLGIQRYFEKDFASSLHLLVPQLEDIIRKLFERAGLPPAKLSKGGNGWEYETFGGLLRRIDRELSGILPRELRAYVERTLSDPTGWNLATASRMG